VGVDSLAVTAGSGDGFPPVQPTKLRIVNNTPVRHIVISCLSLVGVSAHHDSQLDGPEGQLFHDWPRLVAAARRDTAAYLAASPCLPSRSAPGAWLKAECLQLTGSFKVRPALAQLAPIAAQARQRGVVTSSSGNFAQGAAWAAGIVGASVKIVMMRSSSPLKVERTRRLGGEVVFCDDNFPARAELVRKIEREEGRIVIHPFDHELAIAGNAGVGLEILEQFPQVHRIIVPISGGGLISGILQAVGGCGRAVEVWGVQPAGSNATYLSYRSRTALSIDQAKTVCDGLTVTRPGQLTFPLILSGAAGVLCVSEEAVMDATRTCLVEEKLVVEPSAAITLAPLQLGLLPARNSVCVLSGGNLSPQIAAGLFEAAESTK
jgi:threonine dehydratase